MKVPLLTRPIYYIKMKEEIRKQYFRQYLYSYLSIYYNDIRFMSGYKTYKDFKIKRTLDYLNWSSENLTSVYLLKLLAFFEVLIGILIVTYQYIIISIKSLHTKKIILVDKNIIYGAGERTTNELFVKTRKNPNDFIIISSPFLKSNIYDLFCKVTLLSGLSQRSIFDSWLMSIRLMFFMKRRFGKVDFLFRSYSSFEYFLVCHYFDNIDLSNVIFYTDLISRWAYLFANLKNQVVFLQHGIMPPVKDCCFIVKVGHADVAYYIDREQQVICESVMFKNKPKAFFQDSMTFTANEKLLNNGKKHILLVCNSLFWERENKIIVSFSDAPQWNLYVKPHPKNDLTPYVELQHSHDFVILDKKDFPKVDYVISYDSTLATDYINGGVTTLRYSDDNYESVLKQLLS